MTTVPTEIPHKISIAIVCRQALDGLKLTLESVWALDDPRISTVVIDGASTDGTSAWLRSLSPRPRLDFLSEKDTGIYDAMNKAWLACPVESFVLYLGAGDLLLSLPSEKELVDERGAALPIVIGHVDVGLAPFHSQWGAMLHFRNTAHHQALLMHRAIHPDAPFDTSLKVYGDWDFNLRLRRRGIGAVYRSSLRAYAEPGGVSWEHGLEEIRLVASRHGGPVMGLASWALNWVSQQRRRRNSRSAP